jgi:hypothetical protein
MIEFMRQRSTVMKKLLILIAVVGVALFASCEREIPKEKVVRVSSIEMPSGITLIPGNKASLAAVVLPENANNKELTWHNDNPDIAAYDPLSGEVTGISVGTAILTAVAADVGIKTQCEVTVIQVVPLLLGTWRLTHDYFCQTVDGPEEMKELHERETSVEYTEADFRPWTFYEDGTGSLTTADGGYRDFSWAFSDGKIVITTVLSQAPESGTIYISDWTIEELTAEKMVLVEYGKINKYHQNYRWTENRISRCTFEKVK